MALGVSIYRIFAPALASGDITRDETDQRERTTTYESEFTRAFRELCVHRLAGRNAVLSLTRVLRFNEGAVVASSVSDRSARTNVFTPSDCVRLGAQSSLSSLRFLSYRIPSRNL